MSCEPQEIACRINGSEITMLWVALPATQPRPVYMLTSTQHSFECVFLVAI